MINTPNNNSIYVRNYTLLQATSVMMIACLLHMISFLYLQPLSPGQRRYVSAVGICIIFFSVSSFTIGCDSKLLKDGYSVTLVCCFFVGVCPTEVLERCARLCRQHDSISVADRRSPARSTHHSPRQLGGTGENGHIPLADWTLCLSLIHISEPTRRA